MDLRREGLQGKALDHRVAGALRGLDRAEACLGALLERGRVGGSHPLAVEGPRGRGVTEAAARRQRSELDKIHVGKNQLFDDEDDSRDMLQAVVGVRSAADLDEAGRRTVIEHAKACGAEFRPAPKSGLKRKPPAPPLETERQIRKVRAMLAEDGLPDSYAEAILKRMCSHRHGVPLQWATSKQLGGAIAALS